MFLLPFIFILNITRAISHDPCKYFYKKSTSISYFQLLPPRAALDNKFLLASGNKKGINDYYSLMVKLAVILGADENRAKKELHEMLQFETKIVRVKRFQVLLKSSSE